ncbi:hypothetical protein [Nevskia sp.]|uniref:hypothetical protein n=1 Tax=Nevskia sp. TaxID=1929292 RepID=UPI0025E46B25|nr:hypothetical protein [Nevskia sp.]
MKCRCDRRWHRLSGSNFECAHEARQAATRHRRPWAGEARKRAGLIATGRSGAP